MTAPKTNNRNNTLAICDVFKEVCIFHDWQNCWVCKQWIARRLQSCGRQSLANKWKEICTVWIPCMETTWYNRFVGHTCFVSKLLADMSININNIPFKNYQTYWVICGFWYWFVKHIHSYFAVYGIA